MTKTLMPCPFCASVNVCMHTRKISGLTTIYFAHCLECAATGPSSSQPEEESEENAIRLWNWRKI